MCGLATGGVDSPIFQLIPVNRHAFASRTPFYRIGGEEFVVLLAGADRAESTVFADQIREAARTVLVDEVPMTISCCVAVASLATSIDAAVMLADNAMYQAKRDGRDRTVSLDSLDRTRGAANTDK